MKLRELLSTDVIWMDSDKKNGDIVISSRIRLARNLLDFPFPDQADEKGLAAIRSSVLESMNRVEYLKKGNQYLLEDLDPTDRRFLLERHLISHDFVHSSRPGALVVGDREMVSIMVNEEDHLRIQGMESGLDLMKIFGFLRVIDDALSRELKYAYSSDLGYLTSCPTNVGTGMRASVLIHLPGLVQTNRIEELLGSLQKLGMVARGFYGEGTRSLGDFFQISNQITIGVREEEIVDKLLRIVEQIVQTERATRGEMLEKNRLEVEDRIARAYGLLRHVQKISYGELMEHLSWLRLGLSLEIKMQVTYHQLNQILLKSQPAHLDEKEGRELAPLERDAIRAQTIRQLLG